MLECSSSSCKVKLHKEGQYNQSVAINYYRCVVQRFVDAAFLLTEPPAVPPGYMTFRNIGEQSEGICYRDVTSPINELDGQSNSSRGEMYTIDVNSNSSHMV